LTYVKEIHGGTFRQVALTALLDALKPPPSSDASEAHGTKAARLETRRSMSTIKPCRHVGGTLAVNIQ